MSAVRPDAGSSKPWRERRVVLDFYSALPPGDEVRELLGLIIADQIRADLIEPRLRYAAELVAADDHYSTLARIYARALAANLGTKLKAGGPVNLAGGRKALQLSAYAETAEEKKLFQAAAKAAGMSVSAWMLTLMRNALSQKEQENG